MEFWWLRFRLLLTFWIAKKGYKKQAVAFLSVKECKELAVRMRKVAADQKDPPDSDGPHPSTGYPVIDRILEVIWVWLLNRLTGKKN